MTVAYYTTPLSDNIEETPEGSIICRDVAIARTGWQTYQVRDLPAKAAEALGIDTSNPTASIELYRDADDVFHPDTLASFEGKAVCDDHPDTFVTPENFNEYARGHVQNVRKGHEPLESGDWPMIADLHITAEPLLTKVRNRLKREVSCGYDYGIKKEGDKILQTDIVGNHVAVVPKGRAGNEARINDAAPEPQATPTQPITVVKERKPVKNIFSHVFGLGLKEFAKDAEPEELAEAVAAKPAEAAAADTVVGDAQAADKRKRMHDAFDKILDSMGGACPVAPPEEAGSESAVDADLNELKGLLGDFFSEEQSEPEHAQDDEEEGEGEEQPHEEESEESGEEEVVEDRAYAADAAAGALATLKGLRPFVARCKDEAMKQAFNAALTTIKRSSKPSAGSYGKFAASSRARDNAANARRTSVTPPTRGRAADAANDPIAKLQAAYDAALKGGK